MPPGPLVERLKGIIERTYGMPPIISDLSAYIVGSAGHRLWYENGGVPRRGRGAGPRVLCRETARECRLAVYIPDNLVRHLETHNPLRTLGDENIQAFAVLVEEIDHLLTLASRAAERRPVTLFELELHANITKYLVVAHILGRQLGRRRLPEGYRLWARHEIFGRYSPADDEDAERYRGAARVAAKYVRYLDRLMIEERRVELRALHRRALSETIRLVALLN